MRFQKESEFSLDIQIFWCIMSVAKGKIVAVFSALFITTNFLG